MKRTSASMRRRSTGAIDAADFGAGGAGALATEEAATAALAREGPGSVRLHAESATTTASRRQADAAVIFADKE
jgi:hypothetical protein